MSLENNHSNTEEFRETERSSELNVQQAHRDLAQKKDGSSGTAALPAWLVAIFIALIFWGGCYLAFNSGGFNADVFDPGAVAWAGGGAGAQAGPPDPMVLGKRVFAQNCQLCHQANGLGNPGQYPPLAGSEWVQCFDWHGDNHLVKIVLMGMQGPLVVKGQPFNNAMPAWNQLKDEQIAAVLTYVRNEWGNKAPPISVDNVKQIREELKGMGRTDPWSPDEIKRIPKKMFTAPAAAAPAAPAAGAPPAAPAPATPPAPQA